MFNLPFLEVELFAILSIIKAVRRISELRVTSKRLREYIRRHFDTNEIFIFYFIEL